MKFLQRTWSSLMAGINAFMLNYTSLTHNNMAVFESYPARMLRYIIAESFYEGTQYKQTFSQGMKKDSGLYKYIRNIYNFVLRDVDFWQASIWVGGLDKEAGEKGAIPIKVKPGMSNESQLRAAIATAWDLSNWNIKKDVHVMRGTLLGDAPVIIRDDVEKQQARLELVHPSLIESVEIDARGYVKSYIIKEKRKDEKGQWAEYKETCEHGENEDIIFRTYKNNILFAWEGNKDKNSVPRSEWVEPYGFIPLVMTQHKNFDADYGRSEIHTVLEKISQVNDISSMLMDSIRKNVDPFLFANFLMGDSKTFTTATPTVDNPEPGREQRNVMGIDDRAATLTPIVPAINIADTGKVINDILEEAKEDLPELNETIYSNVATDTVLAARQRVESKVQKRRASYDPDHVRALQMCIAIGGWRGYEGFDGFNLDSYKNHQMDFEIADRPVFSETEDQKSARIIAKWQAAADVAQKSQGVIPAEVVLMSLGMSDEDMADLMRRRMQAMSAANADVVPTDPITGKPMNQ